MFFGDTPCLAEAQKEHDAFAKTLTGASVEVLCLTSLREPAFCTPLQCSQSRSPKHLSTCFVRHPIVSSVYLRSLPNW